MKAKPLSPDLDKIEMLPDAWERMAQAVKGAARAMPAHNVKPSPKAVKAPAKASRRRTTQSR